MKIKYLPAPAQFLTDGFEHHATVVFHDVSLDRVAVGGGFFDGGHIADAAHGHIKGSWDGRCRKGQNIDGSLHFLHFFFMRNAEALFFVDDAKAQVLEKDVLLQNPVGADNYINFTAAKAGKNFFLLLRAAEARKQFHRHREAIHPLQKGLVMLPCKNSGGHQNCHLLAVHNGFECGANGHFRFAEAHIAAKKTVHGAGHFHIVLDFFNAAELVIRFFVWEAFFKIPLPIRIFAEGIAFGAHTLGIKSNKLLRHILNGGLYPAPGLLPFGGIELIKLYGLIILRADVF